MFRRDGLNAGPLPASRFARADFALAKGEDGKRRRLPDPFRGSCRCGVQVDRHAVPSFHDDYHKSPFSVETCNS